MLNLKSYTEFQSTNHKAALEFQKATGIKVAKIWKYPYNLTADKLHRVCMKMIDKIGTRQQGFLKSDLKIIKILYSEFVNLNPIWKNVSVKDTDTMFDILHGAASCFNYDDIYSFSVLGIGGQAISKKDRMRKEKIEMEVGKSMYWIPSSKTLNKIESALQIV